jgi:N-acetylmuramoyl-L-alanine amidase
VACGIREADVVLDVSRRLRPLLEASGARVAMTRTTDTFVGLSARAAFANSRGATGFVSQHSNSNRGTPATGTETFVFSSASDRSRSLANGVQRAMLRAWGLRDRGVKSANFAVLRETNMPAILTELGFTNNCSVDARKLASATDRQRMAEEQAPAILSWLGLSTVARGTLRGVVYEDQGMGAENTTQRVPGATVRVVETGASVTAAATTGNWSFSLPAGNYTVEASRTGFGTQRRTCTVARGGTTWCSVGLRRVAAVRRSGELAPETTPDADVVGDAGVAPMDPPTPPSDSAPGCSAGGAPIGGAVWLMMVLGWLGLRRRAAFGALLAAVGCAETNEPGLELEPAPAALSVQTATEVPSLGSLIDVRAVDTRGPVLAPRWAPDGLRLAVARPDYSELWVVTPGVDTLEQACATARCGWEPRWTTLGLRVRGEEQTETALPDWLVRAEGLVLGPSEAPAVHAWIENDTSVMVRVGDQTWPVSHTDETFVSAAVSPDERHVAFWGASTGVYVHDQQSRRTVHLGAGGHPSFDETGTRLVFERTSDDGHEHTSGDLYATELWGEYRTGALTRTADRIERTPSLAAGRVAFVVGETLHVAQVRF